MNGIRVYRGKDLPMKQNVPGARMWAVGLEESMLTYFEMDPDNVFPEHSHEAEQITLAIEGRLTFSYEGKSVTLKPGEEISILSNVTHSVTTGDKRCRAVDAWAPVRKENLS
jgi:quercetin dioxygenase-like cupin family protein